MKSLVIAAMVALLALPAAAQAQRSDAYTSRYGMLSERNIFLKDRAHPSTKPAPSTQSSRRDPERSVRLAGVVVENDGLRAYVENSSIGTMARLAVGDSIARGKIAAIEIDGVSYESNGHTTWIEIGNDFANHPVTVSGESYSSSSSSSASAEAPTTAPAGLANINPNDPNLTVEQKLKLRRLQELKGK
jgi:hypothetical protein